MSRKNWRSNYFQFPRLLDEIAAVGLTDEQMSAICLSMDVEPKDINELLARATKEWERIKDEL